MNGKELLNFANKLEDDHKDKGYKWLYDKLRYEIIKKHQEAITVTPCCKSDSEQLKTEKEPIEYRLWREREGYLQFEDLVYKQGSSLIEVEEVLKRYNDYWNSF